MSETRSWNSVIRWLPRRVILSWKVPLKDGNEEDRWGSKKRDGNRRRHTSLSVTSTRAKSISPYNFSTQLKFIFHVVTINSCIISELSTFVRIMFQGRKIHNMSTIFETFDPSCFFCFRLFKYFLFACTRAFNIEYSIKSKQTILNIHCAFARNVNSIDIILVCIKTRTKHLSITLILL